MPTGHSGAAASPSSSSLPSWFADGYDHLWYPYTQYHHAQAPVAIRSASGCVLETEDGRALIDGISSWWSVCHGYQHPYIIEKMKAQLDQLSHVMFAGIAHAPAYELASRLVAMVPKGLSRVFFSDSGSTSVEVAMKMAYQFALNHGHKHKNKFLSFRHAYHGDTMGAMSICDPEQSMHAHFRHYMPHQMVVDIPSDEYSFAEFDQLLEELKDTIAAVIIEPLVQGAGGFKMHSPDILAEIVRITKKHGILFIADEVATGFGRTGQMFACKEAGVTPDILCLGKALTGGMCTMGATLATETIFDAFISEKAECALQHGPTFMANPLACSAALASLDLFEKEDRLGQVEEIERCFWQRLPEFRQYASVKDVRVQGAIGVIELDSNGDDIRLLRAQLVEQGAWLRPFGNVIYFAPPFVISHKQLIQLIDAVHMVLGA